jgi:hypothetical protein
MYFNADGGGSGAGASAQATPPAKAGEGDKTPEFVTKAEWQSFQADIQKRIDDQSGLLGGIRNDLKSLTKPPAKEAEKDPTLTQRVDAIEQRDKISRENLKRSTLKSVAMGAGVPEARAGRFAKLILAEFGEQISVTKDDEVTFKESDDKTVSIGEWIGAYLKSADGEFFLPPKATGNSDGQNGANGSAATPHPYLAMNATEIMEHSKDHPDLFVSYTEKHEEDWLRKQKTMRLSSFTKK